MKYVIWIMLSLTGCNADTDDLKRFIDQADRQIHPGLSLPDGAAFSDKTVATMKAGFAIAERDPFRFAVLPASDLEHRFALQTILRDTALDAMQVVGSLSRAGDTQALVMAPDKTLHRVAPGDFLGVEQARVESVSEQGIRFEGEADGTASRPHLPLRRSVQSWQ